MLAETAQNAQTEGEHMVQNRNDVLWYSLEGERLPRWYVRVRPPSNVVWRAQIDHMVYNTWFPVVRLPYAFASLRQAAPLIEAAMLRSIRIQEGIQEKVHVSSSASRKMAVKGWVNISLADADKKYITEAQVSIETMLQDLGALVMRGYRFSMTYDDYSSALQASLVCANPEDSNFEYGLSARHPDPVMCLKSLMYKFNVTAEKPWPEWVTPKRIDNWS